MNKVYISGVSQTRKIFKLILSAFLGFIMGVSLLSFFASGDTIHAVHVFGGFTGAFITLGAYLSTKKIMRLEFDYEKQTLTIQYYQWFQKVKCVAVLFKELEYSTKAPRRGYDRLTILDRENFEIIVSEYNDKETQEIINDLDGCGARKLE